MTQSPEPRQSMFGLVGRLVSGAMELARLEATRGRQELGQMVDDTKQGALLLGIAGGLLFMALMVLLIFLVEALLPNGPSPLGDRAGRADRAGGGGSSARIHRRQADSRRGA